MDKTYYTIYKIRNKLNGKIYIGSHKTNDLNDGYMGSGKYLNRAIRKHGVENFEKEIIHIFETSEEMYAKEAEIVNEEFLTTENTYNLKIGGFGGFDFINSSLREEVSQISATYHKDRHANDTAFHESKLSKLKLYHFDSETGKKNSDLAMISLKEKYPEGTFKGKKHSAETKVKMREARKDLKPWNTGRSMSEETKKKISLSLKKMKRGEYREHGCIGRR